MSTFNFKDDLTWRDLLIRLAIVFATVAVIVWCMPSNRTKYFVTELGKPWKYGDLTAPFDFPVYKSESRVKAERDSLYQAFEPYFYCNKEVGMQQVRNFTTKYKNGIDGLPADYVNIIANQLNRLYSRGIMGAPDYGKLAGKDTTRHIRMVKGKSATSVPLKEFLSTKAAYESLYADPLLQPHRQVLQKCNLNEFITANILYDKDRSSTALDELLNSVPLATGVVQKGQKIIDRGEIVDEKTYRIIESFKRENTRRESSASQMQVTMLGETLYVLLLILFFTAYLTMFRKDYFDNWRCIAMLYTLIIVFCLLTALMVRNTIGHVFLLPYAMVPIFARIFMDSRTAFMAHFTMVMVCACMLQHPFEFVAIEMTAGVAAIYSLRELQYRSQVFKTAIIVTLLSIAMNLAYDLMHASQVDALNWNAYNYLIVNGVMLLFAYPLLYVMEKTFGFITDITLIELSNTNHPLLKRMSEVAPGTFQHSIQVGNLAAEIATKIGAKSQLVRTGALYHDIGKILNPAYFTENQSSINPHESISYIESAHIIISHVTDGLKMAEKYNLPKIIKEFISTHHGQGKAKYFFVKYKNENPNDNIDELLFTYPGPNPFTREQAILMMADTVEAASRSLPDYTEQSIRELVNRVVDGQLAEGYFRDCPITFRDISYAKTVLIEKLKTIYHTRVSYPELKK